MHVEALRRESVPGGVYCERTAFNQLDELRIARCVSRKPNRDAKRRAEMHSPRRCSPAAL